MQIDPFTFVAQLINFAVLVALLKRFLYRPILATLAAREEKAEEHRLELERALETANEQGQQLQQARAELARDQQALLTEARAQADDERLRLTTQARHEVDNLQQRWRNSLLAQSQSELQQFRQQAGRQLVVTLRRILDDLANQDLETHTIEHFLANLPTEMRGHSGTVRTSFPLTPDRQRRLGKELAEVKFETDPELGFGIEFCSQDSRWAWSVDSYLEVLSEELDRELETL